MIPNTSNDLDEYNSGTTTAALSGLKALLRENRMLSYDETETFIKRVFTSNYVICYEHPGQGTGEKPCDRLVGHKGKHSFESEVIENKQALNKLIASRVREELEKVKKAGKSRSHHMKFMGRYLNKDSNCVKVSYIDYRIKYWESQDV